MLILFRKCYSNYVVTVQFWILNVSKDLRPYWCVHRNGSVQCESLAWYNEKAPPTQDIISALEKNINKQTFKLGNSSLTVNWTSFDIQGKCLSQSFSSTVYFCIYRKLAKVPAPVMGRV